MQGNILGNNGSFKKSSLLNVYQQNSTPSKDGLWIKTNDKVQYLSLRDDITYKTQKLNDAPFNGSSSKTVVKNNETGVENSDTTQMLPVAYGLILVCGREAEYFEAASTDLNRKHPGSTAILWRAMRDLKAMGLERFNLWGIAPEGQPEHRYAGVTTFKKGFGGEVVAYLPAQDLVLSKVRYLPDLIIERARKKRRHL